MENRVTNPWTWQDRFGFVQAKEVRGAVRTLYCAGQTSVNEDGHPLHEGEMQAQAMQALKNLETVGREAGFELSDIARLNIYVTDVEAFARPRLRSGRVLRSLVCGRRQPCSASRG